MAHPDRIGPGIPLALDNLLTIEEAKALQTNGAQALIGIAREKDRAAESA